MIEKNFDWKFYINEYPDLKMNGIKTKHDAYNHWLTHGKKEGRQYIKSIKKVSDSDMFDWKYYLAKYPDLKKHGINTKKTALNHWKDNGKMEGRYGCFQDEIDQELDFFSLEQNLYKKKIIVASTQWPSNGGSATNSYNLVKFLRKNGYNVVGIFFENEEHVFDPDNIGGIWRIDRLFRNYTKEIINIINYLSGIPDICFGKNYLAPILLKRMFPESKICYLVSGSIHSTFLSNYKISSRRFIQDYLYYEKYFKSKKIKEAISCEEKCINSSDSIYPNSKLSYEIFKTVYSEHSSKIKTIFNTTIATREIIKNNLINNIKQFDIIFVTSDLSRNVKNSFFVKTLFSNKKLEHMKKVVIGKNSNKLKNKNIKNIRLVNFSKNKDILEYLSKSKLIIVPSYFDANPNIIQEALSQDCIFLISENVGTNEKFSSEFVATDVYNTENWINKIIFLINNYDNMLIKLKLQNINDIETYMQNIKNIIDDN